MLVNKSYSVSWLSSSYVPLAGMRMRMRMRMEMTGGVNVGPYMVFCRDGTRSQQHHEQRRPIDGIFG